MKLRIDYGMGNEITTDSTPWFQELVNNSQTVGQVYKDERVRAQLGYDDTPTLAPHVGAGRIADDTPLRDGMLLSMHEMPGQKEGLTAKRKPFERYLRYMGFEKSGPGPGDHTVWKYGKQHINYKDGEVDIASAKKVAEILGKSLWQVFEEVRDL